MKQFIFLTFIFLFTACQTQSFKKTSDGIVVYPVKNTTGARMVRFQVISDKIIRVTASPENHFSFDTSLMVNYHNSSECKWNVEERRDTLILRTSEIIAKISIRTAEVVFSDKQGRVILQEDTLLAKSFKPIEIKGDRYYQIRQVFSSPNNEAFFGLGQHQDGIMNYKGHNVELYQYNSKVSIPFLISNKNYGILWDNYSLSRFGDARDYMPLSCLKTFDEKGNEGGLTATYYSSTDSAKVFVKRQEKVINYEFIPNLDSLPATFPMAQGLVNWTGFVASDSTGIHNFRFYSAGYSKVWFDGKLVIDRWRQCWNPVANFFSENMEKGKKYPLRIEWNPDGGASYIGLKCLTPQSPDEQNKLSLYSEAARQIDYYFIKGENSDDIIKGYRFLTGKAPIMPKWALGFWQSRERYKTQHELLQAVAEYRKRSIPIDNIVLDWFYWPENRWGDHNFDSARFPHPDSMIKNLHQKYNAHIMISVWPKFYEQSENYKKMDDHGWVYKKNIQDKRHDWVGQGYVSSFYDPFSEGARKLFWNLLNEKLFTKGIDAWWMDASEPDIHSNMNISDRKALMDPTANGPAEVYFNAFPFMNAKGIYEGQRATAPNQRVFILTRSSYAGQQRYAAATWSGDIGSRWDELKTQVSSGLNFCMAGVPYWTTDIGGFAVEKKYENAQGELLEEWRELQARWYQYGAFCPLFRAHGQFPYREIYNIAPKNHPAYKAMVSIDQLRYHLMPYIYSLAGDVYFNDYTIMRGLAMDFTSDPQVYSIDDQFMFGPSLLINPITSYKSRSREVYLPKGCGWYHFYNGKYEIGGQKISVSAPLNEIPVLVKEGSIIPYGREIQYAGEKTDKPIILYVFTGKDASFNLYEDEGTNYNYEKGNYSIIPINYFESSKSLTIGDRKGSFQGMKERQNFILVWVDKKTGKGVKYDSNIGKAFTYMGKEMVMKKY